MFAEIRQHHAKFQKLYPAKKGFHTMVSLLLQTMQDVGIQANQKGVKKIIHVIDELIESIFDVMKQELKAENARQQDYLTQRARLELNSRRLEGTVSQLRAKVENIKQKMLELTNDIATQSEVPPPFPYPPLDLPAEDRRTPRLEQNMR